jgi:hypothetical protein
MLVLFVHVGAVIVALGGSLFATFALAPILNDELDAPARVQVIRRVIRRLGVIVLTALAVLVFTGILNMLFTGIFSALLAAKLVLVVIVIVLATYQYANVGARIWPAFRRGSARGDCALAVAFSPNRLNRRNTCAADRLSLAWTYQNRRGNNGGRVPITALPCCQPPV